MSPRLGGRAAEIEWVSTLLDDAGGRSGIVVGAPGMGKTALVEAALEMQRERAGATPRRVFRLHGSPVLSNMAFGALAPLLGPVTGALDEARVLGALMSSLKLARHRPGGIQPLVVIDDAQFLDPASSFVLSQLVQSGTVSILMLSTDMRGVAGVLDAICDGVSIDNLVLQGLDISAVAEQCHHLLGGKLSSGAASIITSATNGNPLLVNSFVLSARAQGVLVHRSGIWVLRRTHPEPDRTLREAVRGLQQRMPATLQEALEVLSLAGGQGPATLQRLTGVDPSTLGHFGITEPLDDHTVRIASPLYAEVLASLVPPGRSGHLRQLWLADRGATAPKETFRQVLWAVECGEAVNDRVLLESVRLANRAMSHEAAWKLIQVMSPASRNVEETLEEARALLGMAQPHTAYSILCSLLESIGDPGHLPALMDLYVLAARQTGQPISELMKLHRRCQERSRELLERVPGGPAKADQALRHAARLKLQELWIGLGDPALHSSVLVQAEELGQTPSVEPGTVIATDVIRALILTGRGSLGRATSLLQQALAMTEAHPETHREQRMEILVMVVLNHSYSGRYGLGAQIAKNEGMGKPEELLRNHGSWQLVSALVAGMEGRFEVAWNQLVEATEELAFFDPLRLRPLALSLRVFIARELGKTGGKRQVDGLDAAVAELEQREVRQGGTVDLMAMNWVIDPQTLVGPRRYGLLADIAGQWENRIAEREIRYLAWRAALASGHDVEEAATKLAAAAAAVEGGRSEAMALAVEAHADGRAERLEEVATELYTRGEPGMAMEILAHAVLLHAGSRGERSRGMAVRRLGSWLLEQEGHSWGVLTEALSGRELTLREQEIVDLVVRGKGNREIARELTVSQRTVEGHLYRIFSKRGITERSQLSEL